MLTEYIPALSQALSVYSSFVAFSSGIFVLFGLLLAKMCKPRAMHEFGFPDSRSLYPGA